MSYYCSKCKLPWLRLWIEQIDDSEYEFCPICKTDAYLTESIEQGYLYNFITGEVVNPVTKEILPTYLPPPPPSIPERPALFISHNEWLEQKQSREDAAILSYINSGDKQQYFNFFK